MTTRIENETQLLEWYDAANCEQLKKMLYKATACGAWIAFEPHRIKLGSIVEGSDNGTEVYPLTYPFTPEDFDARIKAIEAEADVIWKWANEADESGLTPAEQGVDFPDVGFDYRHLK